ncbi:HNH endonuclease [Hyphomicrobium facile]|uniref:5-methylcytosine-specific restriction enzyme A n=1 Tax=Hyphomicrobium facile TaxID=51670 RepID=A0A1I7NH32_9HYPH|nr:HNH endonuclease [Hyphomicrobium facile]SFV33975.1 5-methylcytosine-specific restriction enzyme A [Hyphomicrobium facile]
MTQKNWTRDELILALDFYIDHRTALPPQSSSTALQFSRELRKVAPDMGASHAAYRNLNAIFMKLANFQAIDPQYTAQGRKGLQRGGRSDANLWELFSSDPKRLKEIANAIKQAAGQVSTHEGDDVDTIVEATEGRILSRLHTFRERNRGLVKAKKVEVLKREGKLACEVCEFDFDNAYGAHSTAAIEVHHRLPLSALPEQRKTKLSDLALVCANCHRIIHSRNPWFEIDELRKELRITVG